MPKRKLMKPKNQQQKSAYRDFVKNSTYAPSGTVDEINKNLVGTGDSLRVDEIQFNNTVKPAPIDIRAKKWVEKFWLQLILSLLCPAIIAFAVFLINAHRDLAVVHTEIRHMQNNEEYIRGQLQSVRDDIADIQLNTPAREILELELALLERDIEHGLERLSDRIDSLQRLIDEIRIGLQS